MFKNPFSFDGRIRRTEYGLSHIIGFVALVIVAGMFGTRRGSGSSILGLMYIGYFWFILAQSAKRCHDRGNSGWWQLIPFYSLWMLFADGEKGPNQYGPNPKEINSFQPQQYTPTAQQDVVHDTHVSTTEHNSGIDLSKPSIDLSKPSIDLSKPGIDLSKPSTDHPKPGIDLSKPPRD